jgi:hypothetical protein
MGWAEGKTITINAPRRSQFQQHTDFQRQALTVHHRCVVKPITADHGVLAI